MAPPRREYVVSAARTSILADNDACVLDVFIDVVVVVVDAGLIPEFGW
jgi:hypothetical protein